MLKPTVVQNGVWEENRATANSERAYPSSNSLILTEDICFPGLVKTMRFSFE